MATPSRISLRTRKKVSYLDVYEAFTDEYAVTETPVVPFKFNGRKSTKKGGDDTDHESGPKRKRRKGALDALKPPTILCRDLWLDIFDYLIQEGHVCELANFLRVNRQIGGFAYEVLYRLCVDDISPEAMALREISVFRSLTPGATIYPYHLVVVQLNPKALCDGIFMELVDSDQVYKAILGIRPGSKGIMLPVSSFPQAMLADHVNTFIAGLGDSMFPSVRSLSMVTIGTGIALPTVFENLIHLSVEATSLHFDLGVAVAVGCPKLNSLSISFPCGDSLGTRRGLPMPPWEGPSPAGARFCGAINFLDALPADRLTNFELGIWSPTPDPNANDHDFEQQVLSTRSPDHLREVGLDYEPSRMLLRALSRHEKLQSLGLMRMDPEAYVDLPLLDKIEDTLVALYIYLPDGIWGNVLRHPVPNHFKNDLITWFKSLKNLAHLRWVSIDDRQCRGIGNSWTWTEVLAYAISKYRADPHAPFGLQRLKGLDVVLGLSRLELFLRIEDLCSLQELYVTTQDRTRMDQRHYVKAITTLAPQALALSIVRLPTIKTVVILDRYFFVNPNFFPWPCTNGTLRRGVSSTAKYVRNPSSKAHPENRSLRRLYIKADFKQQGPGLWKFLAHFSNIRELILDVDHNFMADAIYKWIRATNMEFRNVDNKVDLYIFKPNDKWKIPAELGAIIEQYANLRTTGFHLPSASKPLSAMRYAARTIRFA